MQWSTGAAEHCSGIVEVIGSNSVQAWSFFRPYLHYCSSSVHYCEDRSHIQVFIRSSHTWFSYIHSHSLLLPLILQYQHKYKEICNQLTKDLLEDNVLAIDFFCLLSPMDAEQLHLVDISEKPKKQRAEIRLRYTCRGAYQRTKDHIFNVSLRGW